MKQSSIEVYNALKNSPALTAVVGTRITDAWPSGCVKYPCVTYFMVSGTGEIADGKTIGFDEIFQISLFAKPSSGKSAKSQLEDMAMAVLDEMDELGAVMIGNGDLLVDDESDVRHKPMRFRYITRRG